jgi:hypothetical protein
MSRTLSSLLGGLVSLVAVVVATSSCSSNQEACPQPHPEPCNAILVCPCSDGTKQAGGCANGFTCEEACCGHGHYVSQ